MKLSFSIPSKSSSRPKSTKTADEEPEKKQFVTEFDPTKVLADKQKPNFTIPPKENEWRPYKRMKNLDLPLNSDGSRDLQFEVESAAAAENPDDGKIAYGLNLRQSDAKREIDESERFTPAEEVNLQSYKQDMERLPEHRGMEEFEDCPVEGFGAALLAGYGWKEGQGIGKNAKEDVKVKQYGRRGDKEGIGFNSKDLIKENLRNNKENQVRDDKRGKEDDHGDGFHVGKDVRVIGGRDIGSKGTIMERIGADRVILRLRSNKEEIKVRIVDIAGLGSKEEDKCLKKLKELEVKDSKSSRDSRHKEDERRGSKHSNESEKKRGRGKMEVEKVVNDRDRGVSWLRSHIRVRIISKDLGGKLYLKKGQVVDVVNPYTCDVSMDESRELVQGVDQELLETALPKRGGPVLVLYGRHKGAYGNLVERDLDKETGIVRDADSHAMLTVKLEQIAEYTGDPSYIGY